MILGAWRRLWAEPRVPNAPARVWRDWLLVAVIVVSAVLEVALRKDVVWPVVALVMALGLAATMLWRRTRPLAMVVLTFGAVIVTSLVSAAVGTEQSVGLGTMVFVLVLGYALYRWGSGREIVIGTAIVLVSFALGISVDYTTLGEAAGAFIFMASPLVIGVSVRVVAQSRARELDQVRLREREQLARELHDTVAHHVSAMVIRAQAGRVVAAVRPEAAGEALAVIEAEGSRTLAEMRVLVGALRDGDDALLAPARTVSDLPSLSAADPRVAVRLSGELDELGPAVGAAVFRIAQESVTNAVRHSRGATRIIVAVTGSPDEVRCVVTDDGDTVFAPRSAGYGIVGMSERAALLGGSVAAAPGPSRGWVVEAVIPRTAVA
ncbi:sensor histidine kinase [Cellulomonas rhizosphaerae]|uniref:histidine kinase n=1 Tax=Cellulomonas rhizosphaerae TaxID=2293719 RepID=A0A413RKM5_9CELL|nr:histidine kinase [Cellulomonas rhizosphaerae]RHA39822.1 sensor histidine kinase [Cellulomonas rhizosphaerae]